MQRFRKGMPEGATVFTCKNNLMKVALQGKPEWSSLQDGGCTVCSADDFGCLDRLARLATQVASMHESLVLLTCSLSQYAAPGQGERLL